MTITVEKPSESNSTSATLQFQLIIIIAIVTYYNTLD